MVRPSLTCDLTSALPMLAYALVSFSESLFF